MFADMTTSRRRGFIVEQLVDRRNEALVVTRPVKSQGSGASGHGHTRTQLGVVTELFHTAGEAINLTRGDNETFDAIADN